MGYQRVRTKLADQFDVVQNEPEIEVVDVDLDGDRRLMLQHRVYSGILTKEKDTRHGVAASGQSYGGMR